MICEALLAKPDSIVGGIFAVSMFFGLAWVFFFPPDPAKTYWDERSLGKIILVMCACFGMAFGAAAKWMVQNFC